MDKIRITKAPPGFAAPEIREQWVGVDIPLPSEEEIAEDPPTDISIGTANAGGYLVLKDKAIEALRLSGKNDAADFWASLPIGRYLRFKKECCELI